MIGAEVCGVPGPCGAMRHAIAQGTILLRAEQASAENGARFLACPFCGAPLAPPTIADWPWAGLRAMGVP